MILDYISQQDTVDPFEQGNICLIFLQGNPTDPSDDLLFKQNITHLGNFLKSILLKFNLILAYLFRSKDGEQLLLSSSYTRGHYLKIPLLQISLCQGLYYRFYF